MEKYYYRIYAKNCYTVKGGITLNKYFFKKKNMGASLLIDGGYKKISLTDDYMKFISLNNYLKFQNYNFQFDYWLANSQLRISYLIGNIIEPYVGIGFTIYKLKSQKFESDSMETYKPYRFYKTYQVLNKYITRQAICGSSIHMKKINLGFYFNFELDISSYDNNLYSGYNGRLLTNMIGLNLDLSYKIY